MSILLSLLLVIRLLGWLSPVECFSRCERYRSLQLDPFHRCGATCTPRPQDPTRLEALPSITNNEYSKRVAVLASVPVAWGSFEVAVRFAYGATAVPIPPLVFSVAYYAVATATLWPPALLQTNSSFFDTKEAQQEHELASWTATRGGAELGTYLFIGNLLQVIALQTIPSDRAAFLLQLMTLFVPIAQSLVEQKLPSKRIWIACIVALVGVALMTLDMDQGFKLQWDLGDTLVICAAVSYTFHCLRLETFAQRTNPLRLAASKALTELSLSSLLAAVSAAAFLSGRSGFFGESGSDCFQFASSLDETTLDSLLPLVFATVWTGLVPVSYTIYAQSYGQAKVRPATANLIYTTQPIWTATFAYLILGERLEPIGYLGGALIGASVILSVVNTKES